MDDSNFQGAESAQDRGVFVSCLSARVEESKRWVDNLDPEAYVPFAPAEDGIAATANFADFAKWFVD